jgi:CIC family chloride channel protein
MHFCPAMRHFLHKLNEYFKAFLLWQAAYGKQKPYVLVLSVLVGFFCAIAAYLLKHGVHLVERFFVDGIISDNRQILFFALPIIGIAITQIIIKYVLKEPPGHGVSDTLYSISKGQGEISSKKMYSSIITSAFTVGFGGSCGLEGPAVGTTSAIGANFGKFMRVNRKTRYLLIGCGAAASLAAIFKAPIAAIVFAMEVLMLDITTFSLIPLLLSSVSAALLSRLLSGEGLMFEFTIHDDFTFGDMPYYILLGFLSGFLSLYFTRVYNLITKIFNKIKGWIPRLAIGGVLLGLLVFVFPPLYGEGFGTITHLVKGNFELVLSNSQFSGFENSVWLILAFLVLVVFFKAFATAITFGAGGVGGIFAPTLFMGSIMGFVFSKAVNQSGLGNLSVSNFTLVGMAGLMAGIMQAPLTAIFLIAEITGGYKLFIPLMLTSAIGFLTVKYFLSHSVYHYQLAKKGALLTHDKDQAVLTMMNLKKEIEINFITVDPYDKLGDLVKVVMESDRNLFPVVDRNGHLVGVVTLNDIRKIMFDRYMYERMSVHELMTLPPETIQLDERMSDVVDKFEKSGAWNLPVLDGNKYVGFVSKSRLFSEYRQLLKQYYKEAF